MDSAARLRIDGCGRGSDPHSCPLGPDTVAVIHSHPSANASPLLPPPPHRVPLIAGSLSSCQHTCIWEDNFTNGSVNYKKEEIKKQARFFHTSDSSIYQNIVRSTSHVEQIISSNPCVLDVVKARSIHNEWMDEWMSHIKRLFPLILQFTSWSNWIGLTFYSISSVRET